MLPSSTPALPLGIARFIALEQKVSDIEKDIVAIGKLVKQNNDTLQSILDAVNAEKAQ